MRGPRYSSLRPLRHRNFALVWSAALVSNAGSWMQTIALGVLITDETHNPTWTGLVAAAAFVPGGLLAPFGGLLADRLDRRRWLIATTVGEAVFAALLAALAASGHTDPVVLVGLAFLGGVAAAIGFPAYQAMLPDLVGKEDLLPAISLGSAQYNLGRIVGPLLAGLVLALGSYSLAFALNAASFGAVVIALMLVRLPPQERRHGQQHIWAELKEGVQLALGDPGCRSAISLIGIVAVTASPFIALVPAMAITVLHAGKEATSYLVGAQGVGAVVGALSVTPLADRIGRRAVVVGSLFAAPIAIVCYGLAPDLAVSAVTMVVVGACYIGILTGLNTTIQLRAPATARGRILSLYMLVLGVGYPVGAVIQGSIGQEIGVRQVTIAGAAVMMASLIAIRAQKPEVLGSLGESDSLTGSSAVVAVDG